MFTGIVEELGEVTSITELADDSLRITIRGPLAVSDSKLGDSIAVNGVCLTAVEINNEAFSADVMRESLNRSTIGKLQVGDQVNLERPVTLATRLGGHLVQGHVDGIGKISKREPSENWEVVTIQATPELLRYVVEKGSITVDGVSLTVSAITESDFQVSLIPATLAKTTLGQRAVGEQVNLEVDMVAKYLEKLVKP
ncbi:MAG: riboflavin synthase [Actinomycetales bacterium]|nr:riboflavin synthase [Actinomycetales bacterium]